MELPDKDHVARHVPFKKLLTDDDDNPISILPQAFRMREGHDKKQLSVNWLEYFRSSHSSNIEKLVTAFRRARGGKVGELSAFGIGNVGRLIGKGVELEHKKVRVVYHKPHKGQANPSHAVIVKLPMNDDLVMQTLATDVFSQIIPNSSIR